jgi:hypothetical protein
MFQSKSKTVGERAAKDSMWLPAGLLLTALLAVSLALNASPARPVVSARSGAVEAMGPRPAVDPVVHNIGKYIASHQILWPELSRPKATQAAAGNQSRRPHR